MQRWKPRTSQLGCNITSKAFAQFTSVQTSVTGKVGPGTVNLSSVMPAKSGSPFISSNQ